MEAHWQDGPQTTTSTPRGVEIMKIRGSGSRNFMVRTAGEYDAETVTFPEAVRIAERRAHGGQLRYWKGNYPPRRD